MMSRLILVVADNLSWEKNPMETSLGFHKFKNKERVWGELFSNFFIKINAERERGRKRGNKSIRIMKKKKLGLDNQIKCIYFFFSLLFYFFSFFFYWLLFFFLFFYTPIFLILMIFSTLTLLFSLNVFTKKNEKDIR
jgi:hypothetical protein